MDFDNYAGSVKHSLEKVFEIFTLLAIVFLFNQLVICERKVNEIKQEVVFASFLLATFAVLNMCVLTLLIIQTTQNEGIYFQNNELRTQMHRG